MTKSNKHTNWFDDLPIIENFTILADRASFDSVPQEWFLGLADVVDSTSLAKAGRFKEINMVGAAIISAQLNSFDGKQFPFSFAGDGAFFAFAPDMLDEATKSLAAVRRWAKAEFEIDLRTAVVPIIDVLSQDLEVQVARYRVSSGLDQSMFRGGGVHWAEQQMKEGEYAVEIAPAGVVPNLEGLSCRWMPMPSSKGEIISLVVYRHEAAHEAEYKELLEQLLDETGRLERDGHPVPVDGPSVGWPPDGLELESHASRGTKNLWHRYFELLLSTLFAWFFFKFNLKAGDFDAVHYAKTVSENADFRKFQDGLKMTVDCDAETATRITSLLEEGVRKQLVRYGMSRQQNAIMTCIVPSISTDDHIHFIDGADGGYILAETEVH